MTSHVFRAIWPIVDPSLPLGVLIAEASRDIDKLAATAGAHLAAPGRYDIKDSTKVPGSGRTTPTVLTYQAPATPTRRRAYRRTA